ncbi:hypothetical protein BAE44_0019924 [Dichanthelium oligosanthes]|uniref:KIB1-4 beta-propeller domain-containing protein n=1 Tax=Dichanthelium oligosanthes TaxID=888268 RepID=A0A1E5V1N2_9POAL|nr:hypothetical protein BAE44_0019924 [Dichanthelium oligosanthes]
MDMPEPDMCPMHDLSGSYWVESNGDIFLVRIYFHSRQAIGVTDIDVYKMDASRYVWRRVNSIGGATFFLGANRVAVSSQAGGIHADCIYLLLWCYDGIRLYSIRLDDWTISFSLVPECTVDPEDWTSTWSNLFWIIPPSFREPAKSMGTVTSKINRSIALMEDKEQMASPWSGFPVELIELLIPKLSFVDYLRIRAVWVHGNLGVFNPNDITWRVLDKPEPFRVGADDYGDRFCHLVEFKGDLIAIFRPYDATPIEIFKLDQSHMSWEKVLQLDDAVLFLDNRNAIIKTSQEYGCHNRIYLPFFGSDEAEGHKPSMFYDLDDGQYKPEFYGVTEPISSLWIEPNFNSHL